MHSQNKTIAQVNLWNGISTLLESLEFPLPTSAAKWHLPGIQPGGFKKMYGRLGQKTSLWWKCIMLFFASVILCTYANMYRVNTNCWFDIKDQTADFSFMCCFFLLRSTLGKRKPSTFFRVAWNKWRLGGRFCYRGSREIHCEKGFLLGGMVQNSKAPAHHKAHWTIIEPSTETIRWLEFDEIDPWLQYFFLAYWNIYIIIYSF